jgi:hypothetical protein
MGESRVHGPARELLVKPVIARSALAQFASSIVVILSVTTYSCSLLVNDSDYHVGATAALTGCALTAAMTLKCPAGQTCIGELCETLCSSESDCQTNWHCVDVSDADGGSARVCLPHCNPVAPQEPDTNHVACGLAETCQVFLSPPFTACPGGGPGTQAQDQACNDYRDCLPGYACLSVGANTAMACQKYCRVGQTDCMPGLTCGGFTPQFIDGQQELGACTH